MRIRIIGGKFDPMHIGHLSMMSELQKGLNMDKILVVPNSNPHYRESKQISFRYVSAMIEIAINDSFNYEISDLESNPEEIHFSFNTIKEIKKKYKDEKLFFIIGSDQFLNFETWHKPDEIKSLVNLVVPIRPPYIVNTQKWILENRKSYQSKVYKKTVFLKNFSEKMIIFYDLEKKIEISSFEIKKLLVEKKYNEAKQFLPQGVFEYILDNNLYIL